MSMSGDAAFDLGMMCVQAREMIAPIMDAADKVRSDKTAEGWSAESAEHFALSYYDFVMITFMEGIRQGVQNGSAQE